MLYLYFDDVTVDADLNYHCKQYNVTWGDLWKAAENGDIILAHIKTAASDGKDVHFFGIPAVSKDPESQVYDLDMYIASHQFYADADSDAFADDFVFIATQ